MPATVTFVRVHPGPQPHFCSSRYSVLPAQMRGCLSAPPRAGGEVEYCVQHSLWRTEPERSASELQSQLLLVLLGRPHSKPPARRWRNRVRHLRNVPTHSATRSLQAPSTPMATRQHLRNVYAETALCKVMHYSVAT